MTDSSSGGIAERKRHSSVVDFFIRLVKEKPLGTVGLVITLFLLFTGIFADLLAPYGMNQIFALDTLVPPGAKYWLGTDQLGRDMLSRIIFGARSSLIVGLTASTIAVFLGAFIGTLSGYFGGKFDLIVQRFVDAVMCLPGIILLIVIISTTGPGLWQVTIVLGIRWGIVGSRLIRSATIGIKENSYVTAAVAIGCPTSRILTRHILPNIMPVLITAFSLRMPAIILAEASLSFLGLGIPPPTPSWGSMLSTAGRVYMLQAPWIVIWPGLALSTVVYGVNMFGDAVRDLLDPRLRGGVGRYGMRAKKEATAKK